MPDCILAIQPEYCKLFTPSEQLGKYPKLLTTIYNLNLIAADLVVTCDEYQLRPANHLFGQCDFTLVKIDLKSTSNRLT